MGSVVVGSMEVRGKDFEVEFDETSHKFQARLGDGMGWAYGKSWDDLREDLMKKAALSATVLHIPIVEFQQGEFVQGTLCGIHGGTGNPMVKMQGDAQKKQVSGYKSSEGFLRELTPEEIDEGMALWAATKKASDMWHKWRKEREIKLRDVAKAALAGDEKVKVDA